MKKKSVKSLKEKDVKGKRVFVRVDMNVPMDENGNITDDTRIQDALPTIKYLMDLGARVILATHLGSLPYRRRDAKNSVESLVPKLSELLKVEVGMANDCIGTQVEELVNELPEGGVLLLENLIFHKEEKEVYLQEEFAKQLASLADLFVNEAFATAHLRYASTTKITNYMDSRPAVAGILFRKELDFLTGFASKPREKVAAIVGGQLLSTKIGLIEKLLEKVDLILLGGGIIFTFYQAKGFSVGCPLVEERHIDKATSIMKKAKEKGVTLCLPCDVVMADRVGAKAICKVVAENKIVDDEWIGVDVGPNAIKSYGEALEEKECIIWNGPMGMFEYDNFAVGTKALAEKLAELTANGVTTIIAGGDTVAAVRKMGLAHKMSHVSTGRRATLMHLEGQETPGVDVLDDEDGSRRATLMHLEGQETPWVDVFDHGNVWFF